MRADAESSCTQSRTDSWSQDGARNPWSAPTTELWAPTPEADRPADQDTHRGDRPIRSGDRPAHQRRRPQLLDQPGVGPITAAQIYIAWSHHGRCRNEAAFARLGAVAPLEASSAQTTRHRPNRRGDRNPNRALHTIAVTRSRHCPPTQAHITKRTSEGKTTREARRCLKRYIARQLYRLLQHPPTTT